MGLTILTDGFLVEQKSVKDGETSAQLCKLIVKDLKELFDFILYLSIFGPVLLRILWKS